MKFSLLIIVLFFVLHLNAQIIEGEQINTTLEYIKNEQKVDLKVTLQFKVASGNPIAIGNIQDCYGTPDISGFISTLNGENGTIVSKMKKNDSLLITPVNNMIQFSYTIRYDSTALENYTFAPHVGENHIHIAFCQWMMRLTKRSQTLNYVIQVKQLPENWIMYSSIAGESKIIEYKGSYGSAVSMAIGAGAMYKKTTLLQGKPVSVYIIGDYALEDSIISGLALKTAAYQRNWFNDYEFKFYNIVVLPKAGVVAGTSISNMFLCRIKKEIAYKELALIMAHEMMHNWVVGKLSIKNHATYSKRNQWFHEGINDYLAYLVLLDSKLFSKDDFINGVNQNIKNIQDNAFGDIGEDSMMNILKTNRFTGEAAKIAYFKGMLMGVIADQPFLKESPNGLQSRVKDLIIRLQKNEKNEDGEIIIDEKELFAIADSMKLPFETLYKKYFVRGEADLDIPKTFFSGLYKRKKVDYTLFDLGYTVKKNKDKMYTTDVDVSGPAYAAGVRNDMEIVSVMNGSRFSNAWCENCPVKLTIIDEVVKKIFEYFPYGKKTKVWQYVLHN